MSTFVDDGKDHLIKLAAYSRHGKSITSSANRCVNLNTVSAVDLAFMHAVLCLFTARNTPPLVIQPFTYDALPLSLRKKYMWLILILDAYV